MSVLHRWLGLAVLGSCAGSLQAACLSDAEVQVLMAGNPVVDVSFR